MEISHTTPDAMAILSAGCALGEPKSACDGHPFAVVPEGYQLKDLEPFGTEPRRIRQKVTLRSLASLLDYVERFRMDMATTIFADQDSTRLTCVLDYHVNADYPAWGNHIATYNCPVSRSWKAWQTADGKVMRQADFARFVEDNLPDINQPNGSDLLTISRSLQAKKKVDFKSAIRLDNGETQFTYNEEIKGTAGGTSAGTIEIPEVFVLGISVFQGGDAYKLEARLRYRINDGELVMWFDLLRPERLLEHAFGQVIDTVKEKTQVMVLEAASPV